MKHTLVLDTMNLICRANSGFLKGDHAVTYNFFRQLKAIVEQFKPDHVFAALEGHPWHRYTLAPEYKENRRTKERDDGFLRQRDEILEVLKTWFPVVTWRRPDYEADDCIGEIVSRIFEANCDEHVTIVSSDTDFTQLLRADGGVRLYDPVKKKYATWDANDDYVLYKSIKGDASDNITGLKGMGEKTAMNWARGARLDPEQAAVKLSLLDKPLREQLEKNLKLVALADLTALSDVPETSRGTRDWDEVKTAFDRWLFNSITKDGSWQKFCAPFDALFERMDIHG